MSEGLFPINQMYDPEKGLIVFDLKNKKLYSNYSKFEYLVKNKMSTVPSLVSTTIKALSNGDIRFSIPLKKKVSVVNKNQDEVYNELNDLQEVTDFKKCVTSSIIEYVTVMHAHLEYVPLEGYPVSSLKEELPECIKAKRDILVCGTYDDYKKFSHMDVFNSQIKAYYAQYGTADWFNIITLVMNNRFKEVDKRYRNKMADFSIV